MVSSSVDRQTLTAQEYPMSKIFSDDFAFSIPNYQRPYAWTKEQAGELLDDLLDFMGGSGVGVADLNPYFLGSIVLIKGLDPEAKVVDGQQRLTTLTILLAVIRELADEEDRQDLTRVLYEKANRFMGTTDRYRLNLRRRDEAFFRDNVQRDGGISQLAGAITQNDSQKNIRENALFFEQRLQALPALRRQKLGEFILLRCYLVVVSTPDLDSAYRIFSVLNDRGLELSHTDILKADIVGNIPEDREVEYTDKWETTEDNLGRGAFQNLFGHIRMIARKAKLKGTILEEFRTYVEPSRTPMKFIDDTLTPMALAYGEIIGASYEGEDETEEINRLFRWLGRVDNADWIPPAILFLSVYRTDADLLTNFLRDLERLAAGLMVMRYNINQRIDRYSSILSAIENADDLFEAHAPLQLTDDECVRIVEALDGDLYSLLRVRLPVLLRLDEILADGGARYDHRIISVEHVLPQNPLEGSQWLKWFPQEEERLQYTHCLGNLVLLSRSKNGQAQNFDFDRKKDEYFQRRGVAPFALTTQVLQKDEWTSEVLEGRQEQLVGMLKNSWRL